MNENMPDPLALKDVLWPCQDYVDCNGHDRRGVVFYDKQISIVDSVFKHSDETFVPAGNMLGKDFIGGFIALAFFLLHKEVRVITTSVKDDHLRVLWGEIGRFIQSSAHPLTVDKGGPLIVNHRDIRKVVNGKECKISYLRGMVSERGEGLAGHHAAATLCIIDEACHDEETEVLTEGGWKWFCELNGNDKLLSMDPSTRIAEYMEPIEILHVKYEGPMYLYERRCGNFCVTPNHKMLWKRRRAKCKVPWSDYYLERIDRINGTDRAIPRCFNWIGTDPGTYEIPSFSSERKYYKSKKVPIREWLDFLGWFCSEGSFQMSAGLPSAIVITQREISVLRQLEKTLNSWGFDAKVYANGESPSVRVHERRLAHHLFEGGRYCWEKKIPRYVGQMTPELIEVFLQSYKEGDGYDKGGGREIIYTSSEDIANELQILSHKAGMESTVCKRELIGLAAPNGISGHDGFVVGRSKEGQDSHLKIKRKHLQMIHYDGWVHCANVPPHHTLFTRRKGVCMWSGNSGVDDVVYTQQATWAKRLLAIGNCNDSPLNHWFRRNIREGDLRKPA